MNKDNTSSLEVFGNLSKFKSTSSNDIFVTFNRLFSNLTINKELSNKEKLIIIQLYEFKSLIESGNETSRTKRLINKIVYDNESGILFKNLFRETFKQEIAKCLSLSKYKVNELTEIVAPLIIHGVITRRKK